MEFNLFGEKVAIPRDGGFFINDLSDAAMMGSELQYTHRRWPYNIFIHDIM